MKMKRSFSVYWRWRERSELGEREMAEIQGNCGVEKSEEDEEGREEERGEEEEEVVCVESGDEREREVLESVFVEKNGEEEDDGIQNGELLRETNCEHHRVVHVLVVV